MKVKISTINKGQETQFHILVSEEGNVLHSAPNNWKTEKGAARWAEKNGFQVKSKGTRKKN